MSEEEKLRLRIQWLTDSLSVRRDHAQREALIQRLLDTQDQLMFLKLGLPQTALGARKPISAIGLGRPRSGYAHAPREARMRLSKAQD